MLNRKAYNKLLQWKQRQENSALLITGARQVGKTYLIRKFAQEFYKDYLEINFIENPDAAKIFKQQAQAKDIQNQLSLIAPNTNTGKKTLIFFDEIQQCPDIMTSIKFLVDENKYDFILSGSLLGTELNDLRSVPVGYVTEIKMYPLDFEEFCWANNVKHDIFISLKKNLQEAKPISDFTNDYLHNLFLKYLVVGGMPDAVKEFLLTGNLSSVRDIQSAIRTYYKRDIAQYCIKADKLNVKEAYKLIPSELNNPNKRFVLKQLNNKARFREFEEAFVWLSNAGVALPTFNVSEPCSPLLASKQRNLFKLFYSDVGLLMNAYSKAVSLKILTNQKGINCGSMFENVVAQELSSHGYELYYYNSKKYGELDFIIESRDGDIYPIEIKSGKTYKRHRALSNILNVANYNFKQAYVFGAKNICKSDEIVYAPIYLISTLINE